MVVPRLEQVLASHVEPMLASHVELVLASVVPQPAPQLVVELVLASDVKLVLASVVPQPAPQLGSPGNYRGIAISSVVSKALEHVVLTKWGVYLSTSAQQFGFKS